MASKTTTNLTKTRSESTSESRSVTKNVLDEALLGTILSGLTGGMTQEEIAQYAENLLRPQLAAQLESARQQQETTRLLKEQEIENLASELAGAIGAQNAAYRQSMADVETAALSRGMGRSSYTLETLKNQGDALAAAVRALTDENTRRSDQIRQQITQSAQQSEQTAARLNADYAANLAAKIQELEQEQKKAANQNYMTAVSAAMGKETTGTSRTHSTSTTTTAAAKSGSSSSSSSAKTAKKEQEQQERASSAASGGARGSLRAKAMQ